MDLGIRGRVALVTAASKGLGRAAAEALAAEGASVVICARGQEALDATAEGIRAAGGEVLAVRADVTEPDQPARLVAAAVEAYGRLDIVVANAGGPPPGKALDVDDAGLDAALGANLRTSIRLAQAALPHLRSAGWGRLCFITSVSVRQPIPDLALSNVARTGLWAWAKTAAQDGPLRGKTVALLFERPSTRTRMSSEIAVSELGGTPLVLSGDEMQLSRGESVRDTALVMSRYVHAIGVRTGPQQTVDELAMHGSVPVINLLTREHHPCQALADLLTLKECHGDLQGKHLVYVGDGNNVATSLMVLGAKAGVHVTVAIKITFEVAVTVHVP